MMRDKRIGEDDRGRARRRRVLGAAFVIGLIAGGCDARHLIGGVNQTGSGGDTGQASTFQMFDAGYPGDVSGLGAGESWTGYIENYGLPTGSRSDAIHLAFAGDPTGVVVGTMTLGTGAPPPPATDPNVGYPPGVAATDLFIQYIAEGFPYTMANGSLVGERLRFDARPAELWTGWCALETPAPNSSQCVPGWASTLTANDTICTITDPTTGKDVPIDCAKLVLCRFAAVCSCSATTCYPELDLGILGVDLTFSGTTASGSIAGDFSRNIHLTKDP